MRVYIYFVLTSIYLQNLLCFQIKVTRKELGDLIESSHFNDSCPRGSKRVTDHICACGNERKTFYAFTNGTYGCVQATELKPECQNYLNDPIDVPLAYLAKTELYYVIVDGRIEPHPFRECQYASSKQNVTCYVWENFNFHRIYNATREYFHNFLPRIQLHLETEDLEKISGHLILVSMQCNGSRKTSCVIIKAPGQELLSVHDHSVQPTTFVTSILSQQQTMMSSLLIMDTSTAAYVAQSTDTLSTTKQNSTSLLIVPSYALSPSIVVVTQTSFLSYYPSYKILTSVIHVTEMATIKTTGKASLNPDTNLTELTAPILPTIVFTSSETHQSSNSVESFNTEKNIISKTYATYIISTPTEFLNMKKSNSDSIKIASSYSLSASPILEKIYLDSSLLSEVKFSQASTMQPMKTTIKLSLNLANDQSKPMSLMLTTKSSTTPETHQSSSSMDLFNAEMSKTSIKPTASIVSVKITKLPIHLKLNENETLGNDTHSNAAEASEETVMAIGIGVAAGILLVLFISLIIHWVRHDRRETRLRKSTYGLNTGRLSYASIFTDSTMASSGGCRNSICSYVDSQNIASSEYMQSQTHATDLFKDHLYASVQHHQKNRLRVPDFRKTKKSHVEEPIYWETLPDFQTEIENTKIYEEPSFVIQEPLYFETEADVYARVKKIKKLTNEKTTDL